MYLARYTQSGSDRWIGLTAVAALHVAAVALLLVFAQPVLRQLLPQPLSVRFIGEQPQPASQAEPPKPMPMKPRETARPTPVVVRPQPVPVLQTTAPAAANTPVMEVAPLPKEAAPAVAAPVQAAAVPTVPAAPAVERLEQPRHDADYLLKPEPEYPRASRQLGEEGRVSLRVQVSEDGRPLQVLVTQSSGFGRLDRSARETVASAWRFEPARLGDKAVVGWVNFDIVFDLNKGVR